MVTHPSLTVYKPTLHNFINADFEIELIDDQCQFTEGPVWNKDGYYLFSDIPANVIYKFEEGKTKEVYLEKSGLADISTAENAQMGSNGLAYDNEGNLLVCQHGSHAVAIYDGTFLKPFCAVFNGKPFNSPNDIIVHKNGSVFFSDPPYGLKDTLINAEKYQPIAATFCYRDGELKIVADQYQYPNGVCLSPDQSSLYTCSNKPFEAFVLEFDAETLALKREVCKETSDGIKCDRTGNLYLCSKEGVVIVDKDGERMGLIALPTIPANCCWGGKDGNDLLITARHNVFLIRNLQK